MKMHKAFASIILSLLMVLTMMPAGFYCVFAEGEPSAVTQSVDESDNSVKNDPEDTDKGASAEDTNQGGDEAKSTDDAIDNPKADGAVDTPVVNTPEPSATSGADQSGSGKDGKKESAEAAKVKLKVSKKTKDDSVKSDEELVLTVKASNKDENASGAEVRLYFWDYDKAFYDKDKRNDVKHLNKQVTVKDLDDDDKVELKNETSDAEKAELKLVTKEKVRYLSFSVPAGEAREFDLPLVLEEDAYGDKDAAKDGEASDKDEKEPIHVIIDPEVEGQEEEGDSADDALEAQWDVPEETAPAAKGLKAAPMLRAAPDAPEVVRGNLSNGWIWKVVGEVGDYTLTFEYVGTADTPPTFVVPNKFIGDRSSDLSNAGLSKNIITEIVIPEGCTEIGGTAFQDMDGLEEVTIASTVRTIGNTAFGDGSNTMGSAACDKLKKIVINTNAEGVSELRTIGSRAFRGCKALKVIENLDKTSIRSIANGAFDAVAVEEFYIPDSWALNNDYVSSIQDMFRNNRSLRSVSMPALPYISAGTRTYLFANCPNLETVTFRQVEGATLKGYDYSQLPNYTFDGDTNLKQVDLSFWNNIPTSAASYFNLKSNDFANTNLTNLERIILPNKSIAIGNNTFQNKVGINSWNQFVNRENITSIGERAFYGTRLSSGNMSDMTRLTSIGMEAFKNCDSMTDLVIPENVTSIGSAAFKNCDNLESIRIEAKNLTGVSYSNLFHGDDNLRTVTISNKTKKITGNVLASVPDDANALFEGENVIEITKATARGGSKPIKDLNGTYYVDSQGFLYKLSDDGKASLAYVPPGINSYTVPEKITTPGDDGQEYTVSAVEANALYQADDLTAIDFATPQNVYLKSSAFTGWSTSTDNKGKTVQGKEAIDVGQWAEVSNFCDFPISDTEGELVKTLKDIYKNSDGKEALKVIVAVNAKVASEDKTYDYLTGQEASYTIAISNDDNVTLDKIVRIYFSYSEDGYEMGSFWEGHYNVKNSTTGTIYPMDVVQTDNPNVYYYEVTGILPGENLSFKNNIYYPVMTTGGGTVKIWTHTLDQETAEKTEGKVINPKDYMELDWLTSPIEFNYVKSNSTYYDTSISRSRSPIIMTDPAGEAYVSALAYRLKETNASGSASTTEGLDFIRWVNYSDEITLPDELYWKPEVLDALRSGRWTVEDVSSQYSDNGSAAGMDCKAITVTVGGKKYYVVYLGKRGGYGVSTTDNLKVSVSEDGKKLKLTWKVSNSSLEGASAKNEYSTQDFYLRFGDGVILADLEKVNTMLDNNPGKTLPELLKIHNETDEVRHYSYSPNQTAESSADNPVDANYDVLITKTWQKNNKSNTSMYGGKDDFFNITINNTGILNLKNWGAPVTDEEGNKTYNGKLATDSLSYWMYIEPANMEAMLKDVATLGSGSNAGTAPIGDWLTITITKASLYTPNQYQPTDGTDQTNKYTTGTNSNISHGNDNGMRVNEGATFVIKKNDAGQITVTLSGDTEAGNNRTYMIGEGGDFASIEELFNAVGYFPTRNTIYGISYDVKGKFNLKPGQKLVIPIRSTYKTSPMVLTTDYESYVSNYYSSSRRVTNTAKVALQAGVDINRSVVTEYYHIWDPELYMYKTGYLNNSSISGSSVKDGSVIDNTLYAINYSGKEYDHIGMYDYMTGAQVALVPAAQNPELKAPDGSSLDVYTYNNVMYYLLNKPGEYKNVIFGRKTGANNSTERNGAPTWEADITVTESTSGGKRTGLNTMFVWKDFEDWGGTSAYTYMHYKTLVSAEKAGLAGSDNKQYDLNNKAWLGDHQGHRLWDTMGFYTLAYTFSKNILTDGGALTKFSRVRQADTVTYQISVSNNSTIPTVLNGSRFYDNLPSNKGKFEWGKGINVTNLRYIASNGVEIKYGSGADAVDIKTDGTPDDHWSIVNTSTAGQQQIKWDNNFNIHFPVGGNVKILVDLTFPSRVDGVSVWDQYVAELAGKQLENRFYLDGRSDYVNHLLESAGKAVLYKGVYDTGLTTKHPTTNDLSYQKYGQYTSNKTRYMYQNGTGSNSVGDPDLKASTITYYTVLYNGGYDRLYLSDLEDELPKGFTYNSMCNTATTNNTIWYSSDTNSSYAGYLGYRVRANYVYTENNGNQLVTIDKSKDELDKNTLSYRSAQVSATPGKIINGRQHVRFTITSVGYDSEVGKYYLNPGEAVRFGYNVLIDKDVNTEDDAVNTITMPYYDYYDTGFKLDVPDEEGKGGAIQKAKEVSGISANDGKCELMTAEDVKSQFNMDTSKYTDEAYNSLEDGNFMVSSVTVHRAGMTPGIQKTIGGLSDKAHDPTANTVEGPTSGYGKKYKGSATTSNIVNWKLRLYNEAPDSDNKSDNKGGMLSDYTVVDTADSPFGFTGRVYYDMYRATSATGTRVTKSTQYLFTLGTRKITDAGLSGLDTKVRISSGDSLSGNTYLSIGKAEDDNDDEWFQFGTGAKSGQVKIERNEAGKEIMTIKMTGYAYSIPAGHWMDLCEHTMYMFDEVIISEPKYNEAVLYPEQHYRAGDVVQGNARTKQVTKEDGTIDTVNDGIQSGASIMLNQGFTTAAWKEITEIGNTSNKARSDESVNSITLSEKTKNVKYDLYVVGPVDSISRMVIIDDLPQIGDHSSFVEDDKRGSEFSVGFLENNLGLSVSLAKKTGEVDGVNTYGADRLLDKSEYEAYVSTKTEFERDTDWTGKGEGWIKINDLEGNDLKEALTGARSIRIVLKDPNAWQSDDPGLYVLTKEFRAHITFNARINDKNAKPGQIAWNSFGYKYQVPLTREGSEEASDAMDLEAQPLKVGLKYPCAPKLEKNLIEEVTETIEVVDPDTGETSTETVTKKVPKKAERDMKARFIIYKGDPIDALNHAERMSDADIATALTDSGRDFTYVERTVKKGATASAEKENGLWTVDYCSTYDSASGKFVEDTDKLWHWDNNMKCTLIELDMSRYNYGIDSWMVNGAERTGNNQAFTNTTDYILALSASNMLQTTDLEITKKLDGFYQDGSDSNVVVGFQIDAYDKDDPDTKIYSNFASLAFNKGDELTKSVTIKDVPLNAIIKVTEVYSSNYTVKDNKKTLTAEYDEDEAIWKVTFENIHDSGDNGGGQPGGGVVNKYKDNTIDEQQGLEPVEEPQD